MKVSDGSGSRLNKLAFTVPTLCLLLVLIVSPII